MGNSNRRSSSKGLKKKPEPLSPQTLSMVVNSLETFPPSAMEGTLLKMIPSEIITTINIYSDTAWQQGGLVQPKYGTSTVLIPEAGAGMEHPHNIRQNLQGDIILICGHGHIKIFSPAGRFLHSAHLGGCCNSLAIETKTGNIFVADYEAYGGIHVLNPRAEKLHQLELPDYRGAWKNKDLICSGSSRRETKQNICFDREGTLVSIDWSFEKPPRLMYRTPQGALIRKLDVKAAVWGLGDGFSVDLLTGNIVASFQKRTFLESYDAVGNQLCTVKWIILVLSSEDASTLHEIDMASAFGFLNVISTKIQTDRDGNIICQSETVVILDPTGKRILSRCGDHSTKTRVDNNVIWHNDSTIDKEGNILICGSIGQIERRVVKWSP